MAPNTETFHYTDLPSRLQTLPNGKYRKGERIDLSKCELMEFVQYACHLKGDPASPQSVIQCEPVVKLFRRCVGDLMVETTSFESADKKVMSAESLGRILLSDVHQEGLDALFRAFQHRCSPFSNQLGVPAIDQLVAIFLDEIVSRNLKNAQQVLSGQGVAAESGTHLNEASPHLPALPPAVIEITGVTPCSGKTQFLYYMIAIALLPPTIGDVPLQGRESAVVLMDLSKRVSILRVRDIMKSVILSKVRQSGTQASSSTEIDTVIRAALTHLHIFRPESSPSLIKTLESISKYLLANPSSHFSALRPLGLIAVSEMAAFMAQDKLDSESEMLSAAVISDDFRPDTSATHSPTSLLQKRHTAIVRQIDSLRVQFSCPVILTSCSPAHNLLSASSSSSKPPTAHMTANPRNRDEQRSHRSDGTQLALRPNLPPCWSSIRTLHLVMQRNRVAKFSPGMSIEEALGEKAQRLDAVRRAGSTISLNWWGSGTWSEDMRARLKNCGGGSITGDIRRDGGAAAGGGGAKWRLWIDAQGIRDEEEGGDESERRV